jgi:hypothetical protein
MVSGHAHQKGLAKWEVLVEVVVVAKRGLQMYWIAGVNVVEHVVVSGGEWRRW